MPYKLSGKAVMIWKNGKWVVLKRHSTKARAIAHLRALKANVEK